jgi:phage gp29-like protein
MRRPEDDVLQKQGRSHLLEIYRDLRRDPQVQMALQKRVAGVTEVGWTIEPGQREGMEPTAEDQRMADLASAQMEALGEEESESEHATAQLPQGFDDLQEGLLEAILLGFKPAEILWRVESSETIADAVKIREERRFRFDGKNRLRLRTQSSVLPGRLLPPRKFVVHTFGSKTDPYGRGLGHQLYWPVFFKRQNMSFWLRFLDKHGGPTVVGKHRKGLDPDSDEVQSLMASIQKVHTDSAITLPEDMEVEFLEVASKASSADSYEAMKGAMDTAIVKSVLGVTLTSDLQGEGARAATETHQDEQVKLASNDAGLLSHTINNTLLTWLTRYNSDDAVPPRLVHHFPELDDRSDLATILVNLSKVGFRPAGEGATTWINEKFAGGDEIFEEVSIQRPQGTPQGGPQSLAESIRELQDEESANGDDPDNGARGENLEVVADYVAQMEERAGDVFDDMIDRIDEELAEADTIGEAVRRIDDLYDDLDSDGLAEAMETALTAAHGAGRVEMDDESEVDV